MEGFGIGNVSGLTILFVALGLAVILLLAFVLAYFLERRTSTPANVVSESMRSLQADENPYFIKRSMKPHYHGHTKIGYVEAGKFGVHMFDAKGQIKGITGSEQKAREHIRGVHRVVRNHRGD